MRALTMSLALLGLMSAPGRAQATITVRGAEKAPTTWAELRNLARLRGEPVWVLLGGAREPLEGAWVSLLGGSDALAEYEFRRYSAPSGGPLAKDLAASLGWEGPHWALLGENGRILLEGSRLPTGEALAEALERAGVKSRVRLLETFLALHPDHLDARDELLGARIRVAFRRMAARPDAWLTGESPEARPHDRPLTEEEDERIWGRLASDLEHHLLSGDVRKCLGWAFIGHDMAVAAQSPRMKAVALRALPLVEAALHETPTHHVLWTWWDKLATLAGGRSLRALLADLATVPGTADAPPTHILEAYVRRAKAARAWGAIKEVLVPRWEADQLQVWTVMAWDDKGKAAEDGLGSKWEGYLGTLLEVHLRLGETVAADQLVNDINAWLPGSVSLPRRAAAVAAACGFPDLAARWGALKVIPKS